MKSLKSQVTMIMILGIVMFIIVGLVLYIYKSSARKTTQPSIKKAQQAPFETQPINDFVVKCVDKLSKDAIILMGNQGGYTYKTQGGTLEDFSISQQGQFFISYKGTNVVYDISRIGLYMPQPYYSFEPDYPWVAFPYNPYLPISASSKTFTGIFGMDRMPPLNASGGSHSVQTQIETYIDSNMDKCLDLSTFIQQGYDITKAKSKTHVTIGSSDVSVKTEMPMTIFKQSTKETAQLTDFSANIDIRLREIYFFAKWLIENDNSNITFDIKDANNNRNGFAVEVAEDAYKKDDIVAIKDTKSLVYGLPFEYDFARQNRRPALYYLSQSVLEFPLGHQITQDDLLQGSQLKAEDPDEDTYTITITPSVPKLMDASQIGFKVQVTDGELNDYQIIIVNKQ